MGSYIIYHTRWFLIIVDDASCVTKSENTPDPVTNSIAQSTPHWHIQDGRNALWCPDASRPGLSALLGPGHIVERHSPRTHRVPAFRPICPLHSGRTVLRPLTQS